MTKKCDFSAGAAPAPERPAPEKPRRVGTFTLGVVLILSGAAMLLCMFFHKLDLTVLLKLSPLILVSIGVETLLAARRDGAIRYDWVGMVLCFLLVSCALVLFVIAWCLLYCPDAVIHL